MIFVIFLEMFVLRQHLSLWKTGGFNFKSAVDIWQKESISIINSLADDEYKFFKNKNSIENVKQAILTWMCPRADI